MESLRGIWRDPIVRLAGAMFLVLYSPFFVPILSQEQVSWYADVYLGVPPIIVVIAALQYGLRKVDNNLERLFWHFWTIGFAMWLVVRVLYIVVPLESWTYRFDLLTDFFYVMFYLSIIFALGIEPDRRRFWDMPRNLGSLENIGLAVLFLGLWVYFAVIPNVLDFVAYDSWIPSLLLYVALDSYVFMRCFNLWRSSSSPLWKPTYGWLAVASALFLAVDSTEALQYAEWIPWTPPGTPLDVIWEFPVFVTVIAARAHRVGWARLGGRAEGAAPVEMLGRGRLFGGVLVVGALTITVVHFVCYSLGLLDEGTRTIRGLWVLVVLLCLLTMEVVNQQIIERKNRQLKTSKEEAEERRKLLATAVEQAGESIIITDANGIIEYVNPAFERSMGYPAAEVLGKATSILKSENEDGAFSKEMWATILNGKVWQGTLTERRKDGSTCDLTVSVAPVTDESGDIARYVAVGRDISREIALERQLGEAQKMEALGTLAGGVAHDFNNILAAVSGYTELVIEDLPKGATSKRNAEMVLRAADRAKELIKQILSFTRRTAQKRVPVDLSEVVRESVTLLRASLPSNVELSADLGDSSWVALADPHQIQQVLLNLGSNAAHAIGDTQGKLAIAVEPFQPDSQLPAELSELPERSYAKISVSDTGCGIEDAVIPRIYEPFFTTKEVGTGTGLGLSAAQGIIRGHGGAIEVESEVGVGTTFLLYLPLYDGDVPPGSESEELAAEVRGGGNILVVEDEQPIRQMLQHHLERMGYTVTLAMDGEMGLEVFLTNPDAFDVLVTDQTMPGRTGIRLVNEVRKHRPELPVVLMTGFSGDDTAKRAGELQIGAMLSKPFTSRDLAAALQKLLNR